jgi:hypothetical protein
MDFLRRLFGGDKKGSQVDTQGVYFYVRCNHCGARTRLRADKQYDINRTEDGYVWHKTIVDSKCFRQMPAVVRLDRNYHVTDAEISGGEFITKEEYEAPEPPIELGEEADVDVRNSSDEQEPVDSEST